MSDTNVPPAQSEHDEVVLVGDSVGHHVWPERSTDEVDAAYRHLQKGIAQYMQSLVTAPKK